MDYAALRAQARALCHAGWSRSAIAAALHLSRTTIWRWTRDMLVLAPSQPDNPQRAEAQRLRALGWSYALIARQLRISKSTLSLWLRTQSPGCPEPIAARRAAANQRRRATLRQAAAARQQQAAAQAAAQFQSILDGPLSRRERFVAGLALYWGEGTKARNCIALANSDPLLARVFVAWVQEFLSVSLAMIKPTIHCYPDTDIDGATRYWSAQVRVPMDQFYRAQIDCRTNKNLTKQGQLRYGTLHVRVIGPGSLILQHQLLAFLECFKQTLAGIA